MHKQSHFRVVAAQMSAMRALEQNHSTRALLQPSSQACHVTMAVAAKQLSRFLVAKSTLAFSLFPPLVQSQQRLLQANHAYSVWTLNSHLVLTRSLHRIHRHASFFCHGGFFENALCIHSLRAFAAWDEGTPMGTPRLPSRVASSPIRLRALLRDYKTFHRTCFPSHSLMQQWRPLEDQTNDREVHPPKKPKLVLPFGESHWDYLPDMIQDYIQDLAAKSVHRDKMKQVCDYFNSQYTCRHFLWITFNSKCLTCAFCHRYRRHGSIDNMLHKLRQTPHPHPVLWKNTYCDDCQQDMTA